MDLRLGPRLTRPLHKFKWIKPLGSAGGVWISPLSRGFLPTKTTNLISASLFTTCVSSKFVTCYIIDPRPFSVFKVKGTQRILVAQKRGENQPANQRREARSITIRFLRSSLLTSHHPTHNSSTTTYHPPQGTLSSCCRGLPNHQSHQPRRRYLERRSGTL